MGGGEKEEDRNGPLSRSCDKARELGWGVYVKRGVPGSGWQGYGCENA